MNRYIALQKVVELESFSKAAESLGCTQSAISQLVASLEEEFSLKLLNRFRTGIKLTIEGEKLYPYLEKTIYHYLIAQEKVKEIKGLNSSIIRMGVLPDIEVVVEIGPGVVLRQPQIILGELPQVVAEVALGLVEVHRRAVARVLNPLAEGGGAAGHRLSVQAVGAGPASRGDGLPVEGDGVGDLIALDGVEDVGGFGLGLLRGDSLREEIDPHRNSYPGCLCYIPLEIFIFMYLTLAVSPVSYPDKGKTYTIRFDFRPVNNPLEFGYINSF